MATTYPAGWVARVERATKLEFALDEGVYRAAVNEIEVGADAVEQRLASYLKAEAARRKRRLSTDDEEICRKYVLMVANWDTGSWTSRPTTLARVNGSRRVGGRAATPSNGY